MFLSPGDKMLVAHRRLFDNDQPRAFVGEVLAYEHGIVKLSGFSWIRESVRGELKRKDDRRQKIISLNSVGVLCYQLPDAVDIEELQLVAGQQNEVVLTDHHGFSMDLTDRSSAIRTGRAA